MLINGRGINFGGYDRRYLIMKFKALRTKKEPKEFVTFQTFADTTIMFTSALPDCMPETATLEGLKEYYEKYEPLPDEINMNDIEMVEFEMIEANTIGADIRNKLSSPLNLVLLLETYFNESDKTKKKELEKIIKKEMKQSATCINYISNLL